jgi:penicillin-binding protein 1C
MVPTGNRQWRRFWRWPLPRRVLLPVLVAPILAALALAIWLVLPLPPELASPGAVPSLVIEDRHGLTLRTTRAADGSRGGWIPLAEVSPTLLQAFLAAEDHRFFDHPGIDPRAVARAARDNLRARRIVSGASTISMQTARLLRPAPRTWRGKLAQLLWAIRLEARLDKARILEQYLNRVPLGQGAVGVAAGASLYFGADARELSLGQAALLAALAHAPSRDNPLVDPARAATQRQRVLNRMGALGYAGAEELARAATEPVMRPTATNTFLAPHFTTRLLLATAEGGIASPATPTTGTWRTTLDLELQRALEAEVRHSIGILQDRNVRHAAIVVLDNPTGEILAWVGSPDFWADAAGQVDMVASPRQPGSALKPFLFGLAFDRGYTAASVIPDIPRTYQTATGPYQPRNYDRRFRGPVRARVALGSSFNVPSVELAERLGPGAFLGTLRAAGFSSLTRSAEYYGPGLALGNGEVTLIELANGFRGLANGGVWSPVRWMTTPAAGTGRGPWDSPRSFTGAGETRGTG